MESAALNTKVTAGGRSVCREIQDGGAQLKQAERSGVLVVSNSGAFRPFSTSRQAAYSLMRAQARRGEQPPFFRGRKATMESKTDLTVKGSYSCR